MPKAKREPLIYFIDRNLGRIAGLALREAGEAVELHDEHFAQDTPDTELLQEIGARGWIMITKDKRIRHRTVERKAVVAANLRMFVLAATKNLTGVELGRLLVKSRAKMERVVRKHKSPFIAGIYETGVRILPLRIDDETRD